MINCNATCAGTPKGLDFFSVKEVEARAILPAIRKAKDKGPSKIYVLSDPSGLIYKGNVEWATNPLILDFAKESENFDSVDFSCIPRHGNESDQAGLILGLVARPVSPMHRLVCHAFTTKLAFYQKKKN